MTIVAQVNQEGMRPTLSLLVGQSAILASDGTNSKCTLHRSASNRRCRRHVRTSAPGKREAT